MVVERPQHVVQVEVAGRRPGLLDQRLVVPDADARLLRQRRGHLAQPRVEEHFAEEVVRAPQLQPLRVGAGRRRRPVGPGLLIDRVRLVDGRQLQAAGPDAAAILHGLVERHACGAAEQRQPALRWTVAMELRARSAER